MSTAANPCPVCGKPIADTAYVCAGCGRHLAKQLLRAAVEWRDLDVTLARMDAVDARPTSGVFTIRPLLGPYCRPPELSDPDTDPDVPWRKYRWCKHESCQRAQDTQVAATLNARRQDPIPHEAALAFHGAASQAMAVARNTVTTWARHVAEERGVRIPDDPEPRYRTEPQSEEPVDEDDEVEVQRRRRRRTYCQCCDLPIDDCQNRAVESL